MHIEIMHLRRCLLVGKYFVYLILKETPPLNSNFYFKVLSIYNMLFFSIENQNKTKIIVNKF